MKFNSLDQVKGAVGAGYKVYWKNMGYRVYQDRTGVTRIISELTQYSCPLSYGNPGPGHQPEDFFVPDPENLEYPVEDWIAEVQAHETRLGYNAWLETKLELEEA